MYFQFFHTDSFLGRERNWSELFGLFVFDTDMKMCVYNMCFVHICVLVK